MVTITREELNGPMDEATQDIIEKEDAMMLRSLKSTSNNDDGEHPYAPFPVTISQSSGPVVRAESAKPAGSAEDFAFKANVADLIHLCRMNLAKFDPKDKETVARVLFSLQGKRRRFQHERTGGIYIYIGEAIREADMVDLVMYFDPVNGVVWSRPKAEFFDGRFRELP